MFNPNTHSPNVAYFQQQGSVNPFSQMPTGQPFALGPQQTGFMVPQMTAVPGPGQGQPNPFSGYLTAQPTAQPGHRPFSSYLPQQVTGMPNGMNGGLQAPNSAGSGGFLQPQMTGANPFRQSMLVPQTTGMQLFGVSGAAPGGGMQGPGIGQSLSMGNMPTGMGPQQSVPTGPTMGGFSQMQMQPSQQQIQQGQFAMAAPRPAFGSNGMNGNNATPPFGSAAPAPARPASTPLTKPGSTPVQAVKTHQTGTKNPFGPIASEVPPVPKAPTLFDLHMEKMNGGMQNQQFGQAQVSQPTGSGPMKGFDFGNSALNPGTSDMSSIASSFTFGNKPPVTNSASNPSTNNPLIAQNTATTNMTGTTDSLFGLSLSSQPTGATTMSSFSSASSGAPGGVQSHATGLGSLKAFKPTSSFGASLMSSLPPIPGSAPTTPAIPGSNVPSLTSTTSAPSSTAPTGFSSTSQNPGWGITANGASSTIGGTSTTPSFLQNQSTGAFGTSTLGVGLRPQLTGGGAANPFRASSAGAMNFGVPGAGSVPPLPNGLQSQQQGHQQPFGLGVTNGIGSYGGMRFNPEQSQQTQQPNASASLI